MTNVATTPEQTSAEHIVHLTECVRLACVIEASALKPGNVHPFASFENADYWDFITASDTIAPILAQTTPHNVGDVILEAVRKTHDAIGHNANLGIVLLLAPLCAVLVVADCGTVVFNGCALTFAGAGTVWGCAVRFC